jgi:hypothetical protein
MSDRDARKAIVRVIRNGVRFYIKHWPRKRRSLESVLVSLLADVSECHRCDLIDAVNDARPVSYWTKDC